MRLVPLAVLLLLAVPAPSAAQRPQDLMRMEKRRQDYLNSINQIRSDAEAHKAATGGVSASAAPGRFTLWHKLPALQPGPRQERCPKFSKANLTDAFTARWPEAGDSLVFNQAYQWHDTDCYMLVFVQPGAASSMESDVAAALGGANPVDAYCKLLGGSFCSDIKAFYQAGLESVRLNEKAPAYWPGDPKCEKRFFDQRLDHFDSSSTQTFKQMYYVCSEFWPLDPAVQKEKGTIIFEQGAESALSGVPMSAMIWDHAAPYNALVLALEHRYYGESFPFEPPETAYVPTKQLRYLDVDQVLQDAVYFLAEMRKQMAIPAAVPAVAFGGSYGGEVVSWLRASQPDDFSAAIASSAPVQFVVGTPRWAKNGDLYHEAVAAAIRAAHPQCSGLIRRGLDEIKRLSRTASGRSELARRMGICEGEPELTEASAIALAERFYWMFPSFAQYDNSPPVYGTLAAACNAAVAAAAEAPPSDKLAAMRGLVDFESNTMKYNEYMECYLYSEDGKDNDRLVWDFKTWSAEFLSYTLYSYQCCANGAVFANFMTRKADRHDAYLSYTVRKENVVRDCQEVFGDGDWVVPTKAMVDSYALMRKNGGVVFTNGQHDPWAGGAPAGPSELSSPANGGIGYVTYPGVAHCSDFYWYDPMEPAEKKALRTKAMGFAMTSAEIWRKARL